MNIVDLMRDPAWQFGGAVIGLIALVVSILFYSKGRQRKELFYEEIGLFRLYKIDSTVKSRVKILVDNRPVSEAWMLRLKLTNTGNVPILSTDFVDPVTVCFPPEVSVISAEPLDTNIPKLMCPVSWGAQGVQFASPLFNADDYICIQVLFDSPDGKYRIEGRAVGTKITSRERAHRNYELGKMIVQGAGLLGVVFVVSRILTTNVSTATSLVASFVVMVTATILLRIRELFGKERR